ncbi:hypothetical protein INT48_008281 [Thamnidium elegans]|uniref:Uncharacterized protein n=1 Tax=Thamnidium elegans TaxID=101142 RepID=A0A8H7SKE5_9FUNG|nr:hypothetical protein INT48_008281 [Thamnidium elegans]
MKLPTDFKADITLHLKEFLQETEHELWTLLELDKALIKKHPGISKKQAHGKVKNDLVVLKKLYPEVKHILNQLKSVEKEIKSEKKNVALDTLWNKCKDSLDANEIELYSKRASQMKESNLPDSNKYKENDNIFVNESDCSIGTTIKRHALKLHHKYQQNEPLSNRERKIMVAGLSSILDLNDVSVDSQLSLFTVSERNRITSYFLKKYRLDPKKMPKIFENTWIIVCNVSKSSVEPGQRYLRKLLATESLSKEEINILEMMKHFLDIMEDYPHLLMKESKKDKYTENDYFRVLWSRLFELLFSTIRNVRIKSGESVPIFSTNNKAMLYLQEANIIGFKIDARLVLDIGDEEHDLVALEVAKDDNDTKIIQDNAKLLREAKDDLNNLIEIVSTSYDEQVFTWSFQVSGEGYVLCANCHISTSHIASDGLYVSIPQHSFHLPMIAATQPLLEFKKTLEFLFEFKNHIVDMVAIINQNNIRRNSINDNFGRFSQNSSSRRDISLWTRETWYTPHRNEGKSSVIPSHLFGLRRPASLLEKLLLFSSDNEADNANSSVSEDNGDAYGFIKTQSGWYNKYTKEIHENHPLHDI